MDPEVPLKIGLMVLDHKAIIKKVILQQKLKNCFQENDYFFLLQNTITYNDLKTIHSQGSHCSKTIERPKEE